jgi:hypothetical protein
MWQNHRARQAGKYQKVVAQQQAQLLQQQTAVAQQQAQQGVHALSQRAWKDGYDQGWTAGWQSGQRDLIDALRTGRVRWDDLPT